MIDKFLEYITIERRYSSLTAASYRTDLYALCEFLSVKPDRFKPELATEDDIKAFMIAELDRGISPRSVRRKLSACHSFWKYLLRIGYVKTDITARIIPPKFKLPLPMFYKESEMERATADVDNVSDFVSVRDMLVIELLYQTGIRQAEALALKCTDVDFGMKQIRVIGKRNKERIIPVGDWLLSLITRYLPLRNKEAQDDNGELLLGDKGRPMTKGNIYSVVHNHMSKVSTLKKQSPHVLRHTFATTMLDHGADINTIKTLLGHASLAATQVYTHTTFEQIKKEYKKAHPRARGKNS